MNRKGDWSNVVDAGIKGGLASPATAGVGPDLDTPLNARAVHAPRLWAVTVLFDEDTRRLTPRSTSTGALNGGPDRLAPAPVMVATADVGRAVSGPSNRPPKSGRRSSSQAEPAPAGRSGSPRLPTFWDLARAVNRSDPAALALAPRRRDRRDVH